jgi:hypothetical protein
MTPRRYGPLPYAPIIRRPKLTWPDNARVALWVNPNIEFFGLDDVMPVANSTLRGGQVVNAQRGNRDLEDARTQLVASCLSCG